MSYVVVAGQALTVIFLGTYVIGTGWLLASWLFFYHYPDRSWKQPLAVLVWPLAALASLVRWAFTGKHWDET